MKIGYVRVSTQEQNTIRQEVLMESLGVDEVYIDRTSGKNTNRPELQRMMEYVRRGDTVIVESISRFARNTRDLLELVERLTAKGVEFVSKKEAIDTTTPTGKFMLTIFGAVADWSESTSCNANVRVLPSLRNRVNTLGGRPSSRPTSIEWSLSGAEARSQQRKPCGH